MLTINSKEPLMSDIIASLTLFLISMLAMIGITFKVIGSVVQFVAAVICCVITLIERVKHKRVDRITAKHKD